MRAEVIILANPYTYNFLKGSTHSALVNRDSLLNFNTSERLEIFILGTCQLL